MSRPRPRAPCPPSRLSTRTTGESARLLRPRPSSQCPPQCHPLIGPRRHPLIGPLITGVVLHHCRTTSSRPLTPLHSPSTLSLPSLRHTLLTRHHHLIIITTPPPPRHTLILPKPRHLYPRTQRRSPLPRNGQIPMHISSIIPTTRFRATSVKARARKMPGSTSHRRIRAITKWGLA